MAGGGQFTLGCGFLEELVGFVASCFGVDEDGGEGGPAGVGKDPFGVFGNGCAYVVGQRAAGSLIGAPGFEFSERRRECVCGC